MDGSYRTSDTIIARVALKLHINVLLLNIIEGLITINKLKLNHILTYTWPADSSRFIEKHIAIVAIPVIAASYNNLISY